MTRALLASSLLLLAFLAGCADDDGSPDPTSSSSGSASSTPTASSCHTGSAPCSSSGSSSSTSTSTAPRPMQTIAKDVTDNAFPDGTFTVQKGDKVVWTHRGTNIHTVSTTSGSAESFDSHPNCPPVCLVAGQTYEHTFNTLGNVTYQCKIHGGMTGTIAVAAALAA